MKLLMTLAALALTAIVATAAAVKIRRSGSFRVWVQRSDAPADAFLGAALGLPAAWLLIAAAVAS